MRLQAIVALSFACACLGTIQAEDLNLKEKPETTSVYLSPYSLGFGIGGLTPINQQFMDQSNMYLKLQLVQSFRIQEHWDMGMDLEWWLPGSANLGGVVNLNYVLGDGPFRPFLGGGAGLQYVDHPDDKKYGDNLGFEEMLQVGMYFDVANDIHLRVRVPFQLVTNADTDRGVGIDVAMFFSSSLGNTRVKKLNY